MEKTVEKNICSVTSSQNGRQKRVRWKFCGGKGTNKFAF